MHQPPVTVSLEEAFRRGVEHQRAGRLAEAAAIYRQILAQIPRNKDALHLLGMVEHQAGNDQAAAKLIGEAIAIDSNVPNYHSNLGVVLTRLGEREKAAAAFETAVRLDPNYVDAISNLAMARRDAGDSAVAADLLRKAMGLTPGAAHLAMNLAACLNDLGQHEEALELCRPFLPITAATAEIGLNMGIALRYLGRYDEAMEINQQVLRQRPDYADAYWNLAHVQLSMGRLREGWKSYEWRFRQSKWAGHPEFAQPRWGGEELHGKTILLHAEQGLGDCIQFIRYAPMVAKRGGRIVVACHKPLLRLLRGQLNIEALWPEFEEVGRFDVHCPVLSLPMVFDTTLETIPRDVPYLRCDEEMARRWREKVGLRDGRMRVGIVWAGRPEHHHDRWRSMRLEQFGTLAKVAGTRWFSLQKGEAAAQAARPPEGMEIVDFTADLGDFADTAGLVEQLDLVITVDTAVAHLAGAMGKRVWVMLPTLPDWRWMLKGEKSPWYPTIRLFRQEKQGDWRGVMERVAEELSRGI